MRRTRAVVGGVSQVYCADCAEGGYPTGGSGLGNTGLIVDPRSPGVCNDPNPMACVWWSVLLSGLVPGVASPTDAENFVMQNIGVVYGSAIGARNGTWWYDPKTRQPVQPPEAQIRWARAAKVLGLELYPNGMVSGLTIPSVPTSAPPTPGPNPTVPGPIIYNTNPDGTPTYDGAPYDPKDAYNPYNIAHRPPPTPPVYTPPPPVYAPSPTLPAPGPLPQPSYPVTTAGVSKLNPTTIVLGLGIVGAIVFAMRKRSA